MEQSKINKVATWIKVCGAVFALVCAGVLTYSIVEQVNDGERVQPVNVSE